MSVAVDGTDVRIRMGFRGSRPFYSYKFKKPALRCAVFFPVTVKRQGVSLDRPVSYRSPLPGRVSPLLKRLVVAGLGVVNSQALFWR